MFGNRLGWGISAALALLMVWLVVLLHRGNAISPPSTGVVARTGNVSLDLLTHPQRLDVLKLPFDPLTLLPGMADPADSGPLYREAIGEYRANPDPYVTLSETSKPYTKDVKAFKAFGALSRAKTGRSMNLFAARPDEVIAYKVGQKDPLADVEAIYKIGKAAAGMARYVRDQQPAEALDLGESVFSLGVKLFDERVRYREMEAGADLMREGAYLIGKIDPARAAAATGVEEGVRQLLKDPCVPLWTVISSIDLDVVGRTNGDIFYVAKNARERMWRVEAVLKLGRNQHSVGEGGRGADQRWSAITLRRMAEDSELDPAVRLAAQRARDLSLTEYRMLGG